MRSPLAPIIHLKYIQWWPSWKLGPHHQMWSKPQIQFSNERSFPICTQLVFQNTLITGYTDAWWLEVLGCCVGHERMECVISITSWSGAMKLVVDLSLAIDKEGSNRVEPTIIGKYLLWLNKSHFQKWKVKFIGNFHKKKDQCLAKLDSTNQMMLTRIPIGDYPWWCPRWWGLITSSGYEISVMMNQREPWPLICKP